MNSTFYIVIVRVFSVYMFLWEARYLPMTFYQYQTNDLATNWLDLSLLCLNMAIAVVLFCYPRVILVGLTTHGQASDSGDVVQRWQAAGIALIGVYFCFSAMLDLVSAFVLDRTMREASDSFYSPAPQVMIDVYADAGTVICSLILIACSGALSKGIDQLRLFAAGPGMDVKDIDPSGTN
ncbi:hypothetical protein [Pannonibacter carbonis]|uniref:hypothetical protein n=1 Tax=Pannonibacter carbonis TaxID=2067569 RepID=UPI000D0F1F27|nr:hypothetical protein [Pannonibacter carbonis]